MSSLFHYMSNYWYALFNSDSFKISTKIEMLKINSLFALKRSLERNPVSGTIFLSRASAF